MQFSLPSPQPYVFRCSNILQSSKAGVFQLVSLIVIFTTKFCPYFLFCYMSAIYLVRRSAQCWLWRLSCNFLHLATACFLGTNFHLISLLWILSRYLLRSYGPEYHNTQQVKSFCGIGGSDDGECEHGCLSWCDVTCFVDGYLRFGATCHLQGSSETSERIIFILFKV